MRRTSKIKERDSIFPVSRDMVNIVRPYNLIQERIFVHTLILSHCPLNSEGIYRGEMGFVNVRKDVNGTPLVVDVQFNMPLLLGAYSKDGKSYKNYDYAYEALVQMKQMTTEYINKKNERINMNLFSRITENLENGQITVRMDYDIWKMFMGFDLLKYNKLDIHLLTRLESVNAVKVYERFGYLGKKVTYSIDKYRDLTGNLDQYPDTYNFLNKNLIQPIISIAKEGHYIPYKINKKNGKLASFDVYPPVDKSKLQTIVSKKGLQEYLDEDEIKALTDCFEISEIEKNITLFLALKWYSGLKLDKLINELQLKARKELKDKGWIINQCSQKTPIIIE